jgi:hypothetical protein
VVRERSDPVPSEPEALRLLAERGLKRAASGLNRTHPRG